MIQSLSYLFSASFLNLISGVFIFSIVVTFFDNKQYAPIAVCLAIQGVAVTIASLGWREKLISLQSNAVTLSKAFGYHLVWTLIVSVLIGLILTLIFATLNVDKGLLSVTMLLIILSATNYFLHLIQERHAFYKKIRNSRTLRTVVVFITLYIYFYQLELKSGLVFLSALTQIEFIYMCILFIGIKRTLDFSAVISGILNFKKGFSSIFKASEINNQVLLQQVLTAFISNLPIFLSNTYGNLSLTGNLGFFQRLNGVFGQLLLYPMKVYGFNKVAQANGTECKRKEFNEIVRMQLKLVLPVIVVTIACCYVVIHFNIFANWAEGILIFGIVLLGRAFTLLLGPFPEIIYILDLGFEYAKLLILKFLFLCLGLYFLLSDTQSIIAISILILFSNVFINLMTLIKIRDKLNFN